jgi:XTP/dITP diphosphohydrolase
MKILFGTGNSAKLEQMNEIIRLNNFDVDIISLKDINFNEDIIEDGKTFEENSAIKAAAIKKFCEKNNITDRIILTDDSGLCVDKLNGDPGVYTARYAGEHPTQMENITKLLKNMEQYPNMEDRTCKFVTVLTAVLPTGEKIVARGECKGKIALKPGKLGGLTYGPVFIPDGFDKPMGDMEEEEFKSVHNHRDLAMNEIVHKLKELGK